MSPWILLWRFWHQCSARRRWQLIALLVLMLVSAVAEVVSLGAVLPFIGALTAPETLLHHRWLAPLWRLLPDAQPATLLGALTLLFIFAATFAAGIRLLLTWFNYRFTAAFGTELAVAAYRHSLHQPYAVHTQQNSSRLISLITRKVDVCINAGVLFYLFLLSSCVLIVAVTTALLLIDARMATLCAVLLGGIYGLASWRVHRRLRENSRVVRVAQDDTVKALQEGFGGIRDVLLDGSQEFYCALYARADHQLRRAQGISQFTGSSPRFFMEAVAMSVMAVVAWRLSQQSSGLTAALPSLVALALGAQRLLPAMQLAFNSWAGIVANSGSMADLLTVLEQPLAEAAASEVIAPLQFHDAIECRAVCFRYQPDGPDVVRRLDLRIPKGARVGIVGASGAGKSTLTDLLMGLLDPTEGLMLVDGLPLDGQRRRAWQRTVAHVPQSIFLADTSLTENIAFGVPSAAIDHERVRVAARHAQLEEFISRSPQGYDMRVGERGIRLSGGQRQRIGIARALYKRAQVLVLDEATNALDDATEQGVLNALANIESTITVIVIAHGAGTIRACDLVIEMQA